MRKLEEQTLSSDEEARESLALIEAALYVAGRPLNLRTLASITKMSSTKLKPLISMLVDDYSKCGRALELIELDDGRFVLQIKSKYVPLVRRLAMKPLLTVGPLKTLAYIAFRQPVLQSNVVLVRGSQAYAHIRDLRSLGLIKTERSGRSRFIRTTEVFADYFNLSHEPRLMKRQLEEVFKALENQEDGSEA
jgi:segregation and condensation protein B